MNLTLSQFREFIPQRPTFGLFGYPVAHSVSPQLHAALFQQNHIKADYIAVEVPPDQLEEAFSLAKEKLLGCNLTIPHKINILPFLDVIDEDAAALGSVNTVLFSAGKSHGYNTDIDGMSLAFKRDNLSLRGKEVLILGNGGVSAMAAYLCAKNGARVTVCARNPKGPKAERLYQLLRRCGYSIRITDFSHVPERTQIIINGTPVGMSPEEGHTPLSLSQCPWTQYVFDCIYNPRRTTLLKEAKTRGIPYQDGLLMLVGQAARAQELWTGAHFQPKQLLETEQMIAVQLMFKRLREHYHRENLVLCGFMGCGKTSVANCLGKFLDITPLDTDQLVEQQEKKTIATIFKEHGEETFRSLEREAVRKASSQKGTIISLGGGAVLDPRNVEVVKQTGLLVWLDTPIERILEVLRGDTTRPLAKGGEPALRARHDSRTPIYRHACDLRVSGITIEDLCREVCESI